MDRLKNVPLEGELNCWTRGFDLPDVLLNVCEAGKTGLLRFASAEAEKTLFILDGKIIFAKSSSLDDRLGEYLLRQGKISIPDLMRLATEVKPGKRLGTVLVENKILEAKDLVQSVIGQVRAIILSLFRWTEAWYGFNEQELPNETITLNMSTVRLIIDGVQLIESWRRIAQGVGELSSVYQKVSGNEDSLRSLNLDAPILEVLAILSQPHSVEQVCVSSRLPDLEVCRYLWIFRCLRWIEQTGEVEAVVAEPDELPEAEPVEETQEGEPIPVEAECVEAVAELPEASEETESVSEAPPQPAVVRDGAESESSPSEPEVPDARTEEIPGAPSWADFQKSRSDAVEGSPVEIESSSDFAVETESPVTLTQSPPELEATASEADPADVGEEASPDFVATLVLEGEIIEETPSEPSPPDAGEAEQKSPPKEPVLEGEDMDFEGLGMVLGEEDNK